jgi:hypothetical protein
MKLEKITDPSPNFLGPSNLGAFFRGKGRLEKKVDVIFGLPDPDLLYKKNFKRPR